MRYLAVGHVTKDLNEEDGSYVVGGTVTYAAVTARRLGVDVCVVTACDGDLRLPDDMVGVPKSFVPSDVTSTFVNRYINCAREQYIRAVASGISMQYIPAIWMDAELVHIAPLTGEFDPARVREFSDSSVLVTPQGWMRIWGEGGRVSMTGWHMAELVLPYVDFVVVSDEDIQYDFGLARDWARRTRGAVVVTLGEYGSVVYDRLGNVYSAEPKPARTAVDPTGAGDVYAAAFFIRVHENGGDLGEAANFANVVASYSVDGVGVSAIPSRNLVEYYMGKIGPYAKAQAIHSQD